MERRELYWLAAARGLFAGGIAAVLALVVAIGVSALMPIGIARTAELHPGVEFDPLVLALRRASRFSGWSSHSGCSPHGG